MNYRNIRTRDELQKYTHLYENGIKDTKREMGRNNVWRIIWQFLIMFL